MGKASTNKKVTRAASTGGGRTHRGAKPWGWYGAMVLVAILGMALILTSRNERQVALNPLKSAKPRPPSLDREFPGDHWHAAYGFYVCDQFAPPLAEPATVNGIHTHGDGLVHIEPSRASEAGRNATLGLFARETGISVDEDSFKIPGGPQRKDGGRCGDEKATVKVLLNGQERDGDPKDIRLRDLDKLVIAFVAEDTDVPKEPPSVSELAKQSGPTSPVPTPSVPLDPAPGGTPLPPGEGSPTPEATQPPASTPPASTPPATGTPATTGP